MRSVNDIIDSVDFAWSQFDHLQLEKACCTVNTVYDIVILNHGSNTYVLPHMGKDTILKNEGVFTNVRAGLLSRLLKL